MKFSSFNLCLISTVSANLDSLSRLLDEQLNRIKNLTTSNNSHDNTRGMLQVLSQNTQYLTLQEYGCWCFFDDLHGLGKGKPQDEYDTACMRYHHGVECAKMELQNEAGDGECDPATVYWSGFADQGGYIFDSYPSADNPRDIIYDCETYNTDACLKATCYLETSFVKLLMVEYWAQNSGNYEYIKLNFDSDTEKMDISIEFYYNLDFY